ncbi:MAG: septum site-determining protein MinC [Clostridia bacterium]|jgi:septum site-determining protein MinC|nr:septum site-determining protein MinC [Clostridia bacterium]
MNNVIFKGDKDGLVILLNETVEFEVIKKELSEKVRDAGHFFENAKMALTFKGRVLSEEEQGELIKIIADNASLNISYVKEEDNYVEQFKNMGIDEKSEVLTKYYRGTVRSGQRINFTGSVVILGDVNPGAEIIADGNIIILGSLKGLAHAGAKGNKKAFIVAFKMEPTQLRLGDIIARSPDKEYDFDKSVAQIVYLKEERLFIEAADIKSFANLA